MKTEKVLKYIVSLLFILGFYKTALAVCPACTVVVAGGLGISRWLNIDDVTSSIWIGGLTLSLVIWGWNIMKKRDKLNTINALLVFVIMYLFVLLPLYYMDFIGLPGNTMWGVDKILMGTIIGTMVFWLGAFCNSKLKKLNGNKVYFPFQKVVVPFTFLLIVSAAHQWFCSCH